MSDVAIKKENLPAEFLAEVAGDAGDGMQQADADCIAIPIISILQSLSPQVDKSDEAYVDGAEVGMLINTATQEVYKNGELKFIPAVFERKFLEWVPRNQGGGLNGIYDVATAQKIKTERNDINHDIIADGAGIATEGNELADTRTFYGICVHETTGAIFPAMISMTYSQIKKSKRLLAIVHGHRISVGDKKITPPMYFHVFDLMTCKEENHRGKYYNWAFQRTGDTSELQDIYLQAKEFAASVNKGDVEVKYDQEVESNGDDVDPGF